MSDQVFDLRDQLSIDTPELVQIELPIAGVGSRFAALMVDYLLQALAVLLAVLLITFAIASLPASTRVSPAAASPPELQKWIIAIFILIPFLLHWGYFTLFEAFWQGQTPGKRAMKLRVIMQSGRPAGLFESMGRNLIRAVDMLPAFYLIGAICIFVTRRQQRLGDMVAGTIVVHSVPVETPITGGAARTITAAAFEQTVEATPVSFLHLPADAIARLSNSDLQVIDNFLSRRLDLPMDVRAGLAQKLSRQMAAKMKLLEIPAGTSDETFLEGLAVGLRQVGSIGS